MGAMEPNLATVRARRAYLAKLRQQIDAEEGELEITERVLTRLAAMPSGAAAASANGAERAAQPAAAKDQPVTQKDLIVATLRTRAEPWVESSRDLQNEIEEAHGVHIKDNSLLPLLTILRQDGTIKRDAQNRIALAERLSLAQRLTVGISGGGGVAGPESH